MVKWEGHLLRDCYFWVQQSEHKVQLGPEGAYISGLGDVG